MAEQVDGRTGDTLLDDPFALPELVSDDAPGDGPAVPARRRRARAPGRAFRSEWVHVRVLPSEKARMAAAARRAGYPDLSAWSRGLLMAACDGQGQPMLDEGALAEVARLRRDLGSGVGSNLNQALQHANARAKGGQAVDGDALLAAVSAARAALELLHADLRRLLRPAGRR